MIWNFLRWLLALSYFDPTPDLKLVIDDDKYTFVQQRGIVYAEIGKAAKAFRLENSVGASFVLKVFFPGFRNARSLDNNGKIKQLSGIPGLKVAQRKILSKSKYSKLLREHEGLENSILMPWVQGQAWANFLDNKTVFTPEESLFLARSVADVLTGLEKLGIAHCDLSSKNIIFQGKGEDIQLVDIEEMYGDGFASPDKDKIPAGSLGYSADWIQKHGLWQKEADRFAGAILLAEILAWSDEDVRAASAGETFFYPGEVGGRNKSDRLRLIRARLKTINKKLDQLFAQVWSAPNIEKCPPLASWLDAIPEPYQDKKEVSSRSSLASSRQAPSLQISSKMIDFGVVNPKKKGVTNSVTIHIKNAGTETVKATLTRPNWILLSEAQISLEAGETQEIKLYLLDNMPIPPNGDYYHFAKGLVIETSIGVQILGGRYQVKRTLF